MEIIGWLFIVLLAGYASFATYGLTVVHYGFTGRIPWGVSFIAIIAIALWCVVYIYCPFTLKVNP
jgi:Na+/H+-dicarboxylate symporter